MTYRARGRSIFELVIVSVFLIEVLLLLLYLKPRTIHLYVGWRCSAYIVQFIIIFSSLYSFFHSITFQALAFTAFLIGFITVLCIGNYFRAKRAQERQRQRRLTKQVTQQAQYNNGSQPLPSSSFSSPRSAATAPHVPAASHDQESAFSAAETAGAYEAPKVPLSSAVRA